MAKKRATKKPEIDIKIRNFNPNKVCAHHPSNFWIFGSALAMIISYERSASILWTILHGILSWFYVAFRAMQTWGWF
jgi:hypothetical protein